MSGDYTVVVGIMDLIPLVRVYYLDKRREFQCVTTIENAFGPEAGDDRVCTFGAEVIAMVERMIGIKGVAKVAIEPKKLTVHRHSWCKWEELEPKVKELIESVLGERGDFIPTI